MLANQGVRRPRTGGSSSPWVRIKSVQCGIPHPAGQRLTDPSTVKLLPTLVLALLTSPVWAGEMLYNGIMLPDAWPPKIAALTREPLATPPYLVSPPAVIPIEVG